MARLGSYRKDFQWVFGLIFVNLLMLGFFMGGFAKLFAPDVAKPLLASQFKETILQTYGQNYDQMKASFQSRPPTEPLQIPGLPVAGLTAGEAAQLDAQGFAAAVSDKLAGKIYAGEVESLGPEAKQALGPMVNISEKTYDTLSSAAGGIAAFAAFFGLLMVLFGRRFGRLFGLGLSFVVAGIPPSIVYDLALSSLSAPTGNPQPTADTSALTAVLKPALAAGEDSVAVYFGLGFLLMIFAGFGRLVHWASTRGRAAKETESKSVHQTRELELRLPDDKVFDLCMASLSLVRGMVQQEERSMGRLVAKTGFSWKSNGEIIDFTLTKLEDEHTRVVISSKPAISITLVDWGRNKQNIERISEFLKKREAEYKVSPEATNQIVAEEPSIG